MASPKHKGFIRKKPNSELDVVVSSLRKDNAYLKKSLAELSRQHSQHNMLVQRFLSLETVRLESCQQLKAKDEEALPSEQLSKKEGNLMDVVSMRRKRSISSYSREIEEIKNQVVSISTRCQYLENKVARKKDSASDEGASTNTALEKNEQWLEYDQQREAYVRATLARMLWLEKRVNKANQACSQQHNEDHSDERERISQMQEHYEKLLQKARDELEALREQVDTTHQNLITIQNRCKERESEVEELMQQLRTENMSRENTLEDQHCSEDEEQWLTAETENLQSILDEERHRSANFELQSILFKKCLLNRHHADQKKIADLERQIMISAQDLEDEKQNCSYLKEQMVKVLKRLQKPKDHGTKQSKRHQQDHTTCEAAHPASPSPRDGLTCSPPSSLLDESFLECPECQAEYPARDYRELISHLEICLV
ncbi:centrosomal protein of 55 kDa-like isoform X2 [Sebastes fasciatus]|uniref:centrosomal protein of 55 kDa-like isoform X2 n=1 Tax=Sebastes fasciatus TaxID=394691 RepID=UPI003D9F64C3